MSAETFVCIDAATQRFVPFGVYVQIETDRLMQEVAAWLDSEGVRADHPLRVAALADAAAKVKAAMYATRAVQIAAYNAMKH